MSDLVKIDYSAIKVGTPLPWPVYDADGQLLLRKGYIINKEEQLKSLITRGVYRDKSQEGQDNQKLKKVKLSPFAEIPELCELLTKICAAIREGKSESEARVKYFVSRIQAMCVEGPDACLGAVHILNHKPSPEEQTIYYAILCHMVAHHLKYEEEKIRTLLAAAVTANLELIPYQEKLNNLNAPLSEKQKELIQLHPSQAVSRLKAAGITDENWLNIIIQHHEEENGNGYPHHLKGEEILPEAKLLSICEIYVALIHDRAYRKRMQSNEALRELYRRAGKDSAEEVYLAFIKELSVYPPGTIVQLENNELAVVIKRGKNSTAPEAKAIISPRGGAYAGSFHRDCSLKDHKIKGTAMPATLPALNLADLWDYGKI